MVGSGFGLGSEGSRWDRIRLGGQVLTYVRVRDRVGVGVRVRVT